MDLCSAIGFDIPIIQAPMAGVQNWELANAVAKAGGLGSIPCGLLSAEQIVEEISAFTSHSNAPYNLNFFCHSMPEIDTSQITMWESALKPYYEEFNVTPPKTFSGLRKPFNEQILDLIKPIKPPVISFHFGLPEQKLLAQIKSWGTIVLSTATTLKEGLWLEQNGADVIIAQGSEAGGHRGMFLTQTAQSQIQMSKLMALLIENLEVPIIAAGGIANKNDVHESLSRGACAVQVGTSYLLSNEVKTSELHREAIKDKARKTALTNLFSGRLARGLVNQLMDDFDCISNQVPDFPYASNALSVIKNKAELNNNSGFSKLWSGENRTGCKSISAYNITKQLWQ